MIIKNKLILILITVFLISSVYISYAAGLDKLEINLITTEYGPNQKFNGLLNLSFDELNTDTLLNAYIDNNKITSETLENLLTNANIDFEKTDVIYEKIGSAKNTYTHTFQQPNSFLIGVELRDNIDPERKTSLDLTGSAYSNSFPSDVKIDIGNDNIEDWQYSGNQIAWTGDFYTIGFNGNEPYEGEVILDDLSLPKCQNLNLNLNEQLEKISFKINVLARRNPAKPLTEGNLAAFINLPNGELAECDLPEPNQKNQFNYNELYCTIEVEKPEDGDYQICVETTEPGEETYFIPYATKEDLDDFYYIGLQQAIYNYELKELTKFSGDRFIDALNSYYDDCDETTCLVPIKISSSKKGKITLNNLEITDIRGRVIKTFFNLNSLGAKIKVDNEIEIPLNAFTNLKTIEPSNYHDTNFEYENYELKINSLDKEDKAEFNITLVPIAVPYTDKYIVAVGQDVNFFDYSYSLKNTTIVSWDWNFGDTTTSSVRDPTHSYATAGEYTVSLSVKDFNGLTSSPAAIKITVGNLQDLLPKLLNETLEDVENALDYRDSANDVVKNIYTLLYPNLETSKSDLVQLIARLDTATNQQDYEDIFDDLQNITQITPKTINIAESISFNLILKNVNDILDPSSFGKSASKQDIFKFNKDKVDINAEVTSVNTLLLSSEIKDIVLVKKHINIDSGENLIVAEDLGNLNLDDVNILSTGYEKDTFNNIIKSAPLTNNYVDLVYTVKNGDADSISNLNTIVYADVQSTNQTTEEITCGDKICTIPNEDEVNCPEDCKRKRPIGILILIFIILIIGIFYFNFYHGPGEFRSLKIGKEKPLFKNKRDELVLVNYINQSINRGFSKEAVEKVLVKKGWSKKQVEFAFKQTLPKKVSFKYK